MVFETETYFGYHSLACSETEVSDNKANRVLASSEMENFSGACKEEEQMDLPPGFRFHPTDEELISHYLYKKVIDTSFSARAIGEVDLNKSEPWELPCKFAKKNL